ncbi:sensor domain-containing diguanylate cyclase [Granulicella sibirica]|uniref:diguanylate cyclase n=1 Tax=Granulicella sibirica TaxID=2479048 RepID=A0A4Q0T6L0_9BACT|nr:GGDEF domain-containing protein [Granulicella sibirica]RXH57211.1 diguanylate cyclase/phosphodiesterase (GGDEF & EAL domains) with PAS/PAC sensor(s) [Granulicella sibirica]
MWIRKLSLRNSPVALIVAAAIGSMLFTLGAGVFLYRSSNSLIAAASMVEHTQDVLSSLQSASSMAERVGTASRLYVLTKDEEQLNTARGSLAFLQTTTVHIRSLVSDNPNQTPNVERLEGCEVNLTRALERLQSNKELPANQLLECRKTLGLMTELERRLLKMRTELSAKTSFVSIAGELAFVGLSLAALAILFGLLLRDALRRKEIAREAALVNQELAKSVTTLKDRASESRLLTSARDELQLCVNLAQVYRAAATSLAQLLPGSSGSLCMINHSRHIVETVSEWNEGGTRCEVPEIFSTEACCGLRSGRLRWRRTKVSEIHCDHFLHGAPACYLCIPMVAHGETIGILHIECGTEDAELLVEQRIDGVRQLVELTGMAVASLQLRNKLENQSVRDGLTGLFNRHFMQIALERELALARRRQNTLAVLMVDVDHFKKFNDLFGHGAGDSVLKQVSEVFRASVRTEDIVCRYGGEEFAIILPDSSPLGSYERAEVIRQKIAEMRKASDTAYGQVTVSIGVAVFPQDGRTAETLLRMSDEALYRAKRAGRNQVVLAEPFAMEAMQLEEISQGSA